MYNNLPKEQQEILKDLFIAFIGVLLAFSPIIVSFIIDSIF